MRERGREAVTHWEVREAFNGRDGKPVASLLACQLETGRTHQIRVHLAHIGHPLLGDGVYGPHFKTKASRLGPQPGGPGRPSGARRYMHTSWRSSTPGPEKFCAGKPPCRRICFSCRTPCERRYDAGHFEKARYANRLWQPHGDVTPSNSSKSLSRLVYVAPALNIQRGTSQRDRL